MYGTDPTKQYGYDKTLEGIMEQARGNVEAARINASARDRGPSAPPWQLIQDDTGENVYIAPGQTPQRTGVTGYPPQKNAPKRTGYDEIAKLFMDPYTGEPFPGQEKYVEMLREAAIRDFSGNDGGKTAPPVVPQQQYPPDFDEEDIEAWKIAESAGMTLPQFLQERARLKTKARP
jgi:hypothetical protein